MLTLVKKLIIKILNVKLVIMLEYQNIKTFFQKAMAQIGLKKFLWLQNLKTQCREHILLVTLKEKKLLKRFYEKELQKTNQKEFRAEKVIKKKGNKLYLKWKGYDSFFNIWIEDIV